MDRRQWREAKIGVMWSVFLALVNSLAAASVNVQWMTEEDPNIMNYSNRGGR